MILFFAALAGPQPGQVDPLPAELAQVLYGIFVVNFFVLGYLGIKPPSDVGTLISQIGTLFYFGFFLLMPWWSRIGEFKPVPDRVTFQPTERAAAAINNMKKLLLAPRSPALSAGSSRRARRRRRHRLGQVPDRAR